MLSSMHNHLPESCERLKYTGLRVRVSASSSHLITMCLLRIICVSAAEQEEVIPVAAPHSAGSSVGLWSYTRPCNNNFTLRPPPSYPLECPWTRNWIPTISRSTALWLRLNPDLPAGARNRLRLDRTPAKTSRVCGNDTKHDQSFPSNFMFQYSAVNSMQTEKERLFTATASSHTQTD